MSDEDVTHIDLPETNLTPVKLLTINNKRYRCELQEDEEQQEQQERQPSRQSQTAPPSRLSNATPPAASRQSLSRLSNNGTPAPTSQSRLSNAAPAVSSQSSASFRTSAAPGSAKSRQSRTSFSQQEIFDETAESTHSVHTSVSVQAGPVSRSASRASQHQQQAQSDTGKIIFYTIFTVNPDLVFPGPLFKRIDLKLFVKRKRIDLKLFE